MRGPSPALKTWGPGPWIRSQAPAERFSAARGLGAVDAWYLSPTHREHAIIRQAALSGLAAGLWKAFDGIRRIGVMYVAAMAGFPFQLAFAYLAFFSGLAYHGVDRVLQI